MEQKSLKLSSVASWKSVRTLFERPLFGGFKMNHFEQSSVYFSVSIIIIHRSRCKIIRVTIFQRVMVECVKGSPKENLSHPYKACKKKLKASECNELEKKISPLRNSV